MKIHIKKLNLQKDIKKLLSNFMSLSLLQIVNYILPLITVPYLIRVIGVNYFGFLAFATAIITYFQIFIDYGFNLTATREISIYRDNKEKIIEIFSSVITIKFILMVISFFLLSILVFSFERFSKDWFIYFLAFGAVVGQTLFPIWFFQGMERMKYITYLNILSKLVFTVAIFVFVHQQNDFYLVPIFTSFGFIIAGIWSLVLIKKEFGISFESQSIQTLTFYLKDGWHVFKATSFGSLYRESNIFILGLFASSTVVAYYVVAEKIIKSIQSLQTPIGQALFPYLSQKNHKTVNANILKYVKYAFLLYFTIWLMVFLNSEFIIRIFTGDLNNNIVFDFKVLSFIIIIGGMSYYLGVLGLLSRGKNKEFSSAVMIAGFTNIVLCFFLSYLFKDNGAVYSVLISEIILFVIIYKKFNLRAYK